MDDTPVAAGSLQERLRAQREGMARRDPILLDVPGYPGLVAKYHALTYKQERKLYARVEGRDPDEAETLFAMDAMLNACDDLLDRQPDGSLRSLEAKWSVSTAADLFGAQFDAMDGQTPTGRQAMEAIFPDDRQLMRHFVDLEQRSDEIVAKVDADLPGESDAGVTAV